MNNKILRKKLNDILSNYARDTDVDVQDFYVDLILDLMETVMKDTVPRGVTNKFEESDKINSNYTWMLNSGYTQAMLDVLNNIYKLFPNETRED